MRLSCLRPFTAVAAFLAIAGCSDVPAAPETAVPFGGSPELKVYPTYAADMKSADVIVEPSGGLFVLGKHSIWFPANSICDPELSSYGVTEWDNPCTPIKKPIRIHATLVEQDGRSWVDFKPELRFVPSRHESKWVYLFMQTESSKRGQGSNAPTILWSPAIGVAGIDESLTDRTLRTEWSREWKGVYRRIKHFSGYNVHSGYKAAY